MASVVSGNGLGLFNSSWTQLGNRLGGNSLLGQSRDSQYINVATGNLVVQSLDEQLQFRGLSIGQLRTYNSLGLSSQTGADGWLTGFERRVELLSGTVNEVDSVMRLHVGDGSYQDFTYTSQDLYTSSTGDGAHDTLRWSDTSRTWRYLEGSSRREDLYADHASATLQGRLTRIRDLKSDSSDPVTWFVVYGASNRIAQVRSGDGTTTGDALLFGYDSTGRLSSLSTREAGILRSQVGYEYDTIGRLTAVTTDLTPEDGARDRDVWNAGIAANNDGYVFRTSYTYADASGLRIANVRQSDGFLASFTYDSAGRVLTTTQGDSNTDDTDGVGQTLTFAYDDSNWSTDVTDGAGRTWTYFFDRAKQVTEVRSPAIDGLRDSTRYTYDAAGNVTRMQMERGGNALALEEFSYDANGNVLWHWEYTNPGQGTAARATRRTYTAANQLASETLYTGLDADGAQGTDLPTGGLTTRYIHDAQSRLRYTVDATGAVTEWEYAATGNGVGQAVSVRQYLGEAFAGTASLSELSAWATGERKASSTLTESAYGLKGRLSQVRSFANVDGAGVGVADDFEQIVNYVYDAQGMLRQRATLRRSSGNDGTGERDLVQTTTYGYDGMGRLLSQVDSEQVGVQVSIVRRTSTWAYIDSARSVRTSIEGGMAADGRSDNDLLRIELRNAAGQVVSSTQSAASGAGASRTTSQIYDATGRLRATQDANGARTYFFYDAEGNLSGRADEAGTLTEYVRDELGHVVATTVYATRVDTSAWLPANSVVVVELAAVRPTATGEDRTTRATYDAPGRLLTNTDGEGGLTTYTYDGANQLIKVRVTDAAGSASTARTLRYFYDRAGRQVASLDAEGYLVESQYDRAGRRIALIAYAAATNAALRDHGTLDQLRPTTGADDQRTRYFYDGRGNVIGTLDAEGYFTEAVYDEARNERAQRTYDIRLEGLLGDESLAQLRSYTQRHPRRELRSSYDADGRMILRRDAEGMLTRFSYDVMGHLVRTETAADSSEVRENNARYDVFGNLIGELSGEGSSHLQAGMSEAALDAVYAQYGVRHQYDALNHRIESIDAEGNKTWYFYDSAGRMTHTVRGMTDRAGVRNAEGEVTETRYDAFGQVRESIAYTGRLTIGAPFNRDQVAGAISVLDYVARHDSRIALTYDRRGLALTRTDAENYLTRYAYNAFGELVRETAKVGPQDYSVSAYRYDRMGRLLSTTQDVGGIGRTLSQTWDAFGRATSSIDGRGGILVRQYDRLGRQVEQHQYVDGRLESASTTYDAYSRTVTQTDALGRSTSYYYNDQDHSVEVWTPEGVVMRTERNLHSETVRIVDGLKNEVSYDYDLDGRLVHTTLADGSELAQDYDVRGQLIRTSDGTGHIARFTYDAAGRVLKRIEDPAGLRLVTRYTYDGQGRQIAVTGPDHSVTRYQYDANGRLRATVRDANGLALRTSYTWDGLGRQLSVTEGAGTTDARTVAYSYDGLGRRIAETVDPGANGLNLLTSFAYDGNDNVVNRTDADGRISYFVYDAANRLTWSVDGAGGVIRSYYDAAGREVGQRHYANAIRASTLNGVVSAADVELRLMVDDTRDVQFYKAYDGDGRLQFTVDGAGSVVGMRCDAANRLTQTRRYAVAVSLSAELRGQLLAGDHASDALEVLMVPQGGGLPSSSSDQVTSYVYDAAGRVRFTIDAQGAVSETRYDAAGRAIMSIGYANSNPSQDGRFLSLSDEDQARLRNGEFSDEAFAAFVSDQGLSEDRVTANVYDKVGRLRYTATKATEPYRDEPSPSYFGARGSFVGSGLESGDQWVEDAAIREFRYDQAGRVVAEVAYGRRVDLYWDGSSELGKQLADIPPTETRITRYAYDTAGRLRFSIDSASGVVEQRYDAVGNPIESRAYGALILLQAVSEAGVATAVASIDYRATHSEYDDAGRLIARSDALNHTEQFAYDGAGLLVAYTNRDGNTWTYEYDNAGRKILETSPPVPVSTPDIAGVIRTTLRPVETRLFYDGQGNVIARTEDADGPNPRTTRYDYDNRGHQIRTAFLDAGRLDEGTGEIVLTGQSPSTEVTYDTHGRAVMQRDVRGNYSHKVYNALDQVIFEIDQAGGVTGYEYSEYGQQTHVRRYATLVQIPAGQVLDEIALRNVLVADEENDRVLVTQYDSRGQKTTVEQVGEGSYYGQPQTDFFYDTYGQLVQSMQWQFRHSEIAPRNATTDYYYDAVGRQIRVVDPEGYVTTTAYNATGEVVERIEYARALKPAPEMQPYDWYDQEPTRYAYGEGPELPEPGDAIVGFDRVCRYEYDALGRKTAETTQRHSRDADGNAGANDVVTQTIYDHEGHALSVLVDGVATRTAYDALGRVIDVTESARDVLRQDAASRLTDAASGLASASLYEHVSPYSAMYYDAFGNTVQVRRFANGLHDGEIAPIGSARDVVQTTRYDFQGRAVWEKDAAGTVYVKEYDAADNLVQTRSRLDGSEGRWSMVVVSAQYDQAGRQTASSVARDLYQDDLSLGQRIVDTQSQVRYNAFGEIIAKDERLDASLATADFHAQYVYDEYGRLTGTNAQGGIWHFYDYDLAGNQVVEHHEVRTQTPWSSGEIVATAYTSSEVDALGRTVRQQLPAGEQGSNGPVILQRYDRWGNVIAVIDPRGALTEYRYNELNQLVQEVRPDVRVVHRDGTEARERPVNQWFYDRLGRLVGTRDANGNIRRTTYDAAGRSVRSSDANGNAALFGYDTFGQQLLTQDAFGHLTFRDFDAAGRVVAQGDYLSGIDGMARMRQVRERYELSQNGDRLKVTDALGNSAVYDYDSRALVLRSRSAAGVVMSYGYDTQGNKTRETNALSDPGLLTVSRPVYRGGLLDYKVAVVGAALSFTPPAGMFTTASGGAVALTAVVEYGNGVDGFHAVNDLTWNAAEGRLEGTPQQTGAYRLTVIATSASGETVSVRMAINVVSQAIFDANFAQDPVAVTGLQIQTPSVGQYLSYTIPDGCFVDPQGGTLTYSASVSVTRYVYDAETHTRYPETEEVPLGSAPTTSSWLTFDPVTRTLSGTVPNGVSVTITITIAATDNEGRAATQSLLIRPQGADGAAGGRRTYTDDEGEIVFLDEQTWDYDFFGRLTDHNDLSGADYDYSYDAQTGQQIDQSSKWTEDGRQYSTPLTDFWGPDRWREYGLGDNLGELAFPDPVLVNDPARSFSYYANGQLREIREGSNWCRYAYDASGNRVADESYTADANGQILHVRTQITYDLQNRIVQVTQDDVDEARRVLDMRYGYDAMGNRTRVEAYDAYDPTAPIINAPENHAAIINQDLIHVPLAIVGSPWRFQLPAGAVVDPDGDPLYFSIRQENGDPIPGWLIFDSATRTFSGIPPAQTSVHLVIRARDMGDAGGAFNLRIDCVDDLRGQVNDHAQPILVAHGGEWEVSPWGLFEFNGALPVHFAATALDGSPLPDWISGVAFYSNNTPGLRLHFNGALVPAGVSSVDLALHLTSPTGATDTTIVHVKLNHPLEWRGKTTHLIEPGVEWRMTIDPATMLVDAEGTGVDTSRWDGGFGIDWGQDWLSYDSDTHTLHGIPPASGGSNNTLGEGRWTVGLHFQDADGALTRIALILDATSAVAAIRPVPQQVVTTGQAFDLTLPTDLFAQRAGLPLSYEARLVGLDYNAPSWWGGQASLNRHYDLALPTWLNFDAGTLHLTGTAPDAPRHFTLEVTARDGNGAVGTKLILITVAEPGHDVARAHSDGIDVGRLLGPYDSGRNQWDPLAIGLDRSHYAPLPMLGADINIVYTEGEPFSFTVPESYLRGSDGLQLFPADLPEGVTYNAATRTFSGTFASTVSDQGRSIMLVDRNGVVGQGALRFARSGWEYAFATYHGGVSDAAGTVGEPFAYQFPASAFTTDDAQGLIFGGEIVRVDEQGLALDGWLTAGRTPQYLGNGEYGINNTLGLVLDRRTGKLSGCPTTAGTYMVAITCNGATARYLLTIADGQYNAPIAQVPVPTQEPQIGQPWSFQLPANAMVDAEGGQLSFLPAILYDDYHNRDQSLPGWLHFDQVTGTFSGTPQAMDYWAQTIVVPVVNADGEISTLRFGLIPTQPAPPTPGPLPFNSDFERGDTGWNKGAGWSVVQESAGGDAYTGAWSAQYNGHGTASISNNQRVPVVPGQTVTASCMVQQGASSAGDASGAVVLEWYDAHGNPLSWNVGNVVSSGSNSEWHKSSLTMEVPPGAAFMSIAGSANSDTGKSLWLDTFEWSYQRMAPASTTPSVPKTYWYDYDAENRVTVANGTLSNGQIVLAHADTSYALDYDEAGRAVRRRFLQGEAVMQETTRYDERGQRVQVFQAQALDGGAGAVQAESYDYDAVGHQTKHRQFDDSGALKHLDSLVYDADGRTLSQASFGRSLDGSGYGEWAEGEGLALLGKVDDGSYGYDQAGRLRGYSYYAARNEVGSGAGAQDPVGYVHRYVYQYEGRESYLEKQVHGSSNNSNFRASQSVSAYDAWGRRTAVREQTPLPGNLGTLDDRIRYFSFDGDGNILRRLEGTLVNGGHFNQTAGQIDQTQRYAYVGGQQVASGKNTGELDVIGRLTAYDSSEIGSVTITVQAGDTLRGIAQRVYGNGNLWYVLAEANAITDEQLTAGTTLHVPEVKVTANDATTFKPFNPGEAIGSTSPGLPYITPPPNNGCNKIVAVLIRVVAVVVAAVVAYYSGPQNGYAAYAAIIGVVGEAAAQKYENNVGLREGYSWGAIAMAAMPYGGGAANGWQAVGAAMVNAGTRYVGAYAIDKTLGVENTHFSLRTMGTSMAQSGAAAGIVQMGNPQGTTSIQTPNAAGLAPVVANAPFNWGTVAAQAVMRQVSNYAIDKAFNGSDAHWSNGLALVGIAGDLAQARIHKAKQDKTQRELGDRAAVRSGFPSLLDPDYKPDWLYGSDDPALAGSAGQARAGAGSASSATSASAATSSGSYEDAIAASRDRARELNGLKGAGTKLTPNEVAELVYNSHLYSKDFGQKVFGTIPSPVGLDEEQLKSWNAQWAEFDKTLPENHGTVLAADTVYRPITNAESLAAADAIVARDAQLLVGGYAAAAALGAGGALAVEFAPALWAGGRAYVSTLLNPTRNLVAWNEAVAVGAETVFMGDALGTGSLVVTGAAGVRVAAHELGDVAREARILAAGAGNVHVPVATPARYSKTLESVSSWSDLGVPGRIDYSRGLANELRFNFNEGYTKLPDYLSDDLYLVSYHSAAEVGRGRSLKYWTTLDQANAMGSLGQVHRELALMPEWGSRDYVSLARIPAGTQVEAYLGTARYQQDFVTPGRSIFLSGHGTQILFRSFDPRWVVETRPLLGH